eukprot:COSAG06_NODE_569_length_14130_cov_5.966930_3_plen_86_part_00
MALVSHSESGLHSRSLVSVASVLSNSDTESHVLRAWQTRFAVSVGAANWNCSPVVHSDHACCTTLAITAPLMACNSQTTVAVPLS